MQLNTGFIIQARTSSTRLPNKVLKPFYNDYTILDIILKKLIQEFNHYPIILATTTNPADDILEETAKKWHINLFRGDENNVLNRFIIAAEQYQLNGIIRICSDNPFLDMEAMHKLLKEAIGLQYDYVSYRVHAKPAIKTHYGFWSEFVTISALKKISHLSTNKIHFEHVTNFIYENPDNFNIKWIEVPKYVKEEELRFTVDTLEDFKLQQKIYLKLIQLNKDFRMKDIFTFISSNKSYQEIMKRHITSNTK